MKPSDLPPTRANLIGTVVWGVLLSFSAVVNGVLTAIVGDDHAGIGLIVKHLVSLGHRSIGHVAGPQHLSIGVGRREAFVAWMNSEGLDVRPSQIVEAQSFRTDTGRAACRRLLKARPDLTAIVAANDLIALGCFDDLAERGVSLPAQMSVTGYNDMTFIDRVTPALTSVSVPYVEMGAAAPAFSWASSAGKKLRELESRSW